MLKNKALNRKIETTIVGAKTRKDRLLGIEGRDLFIFIS
jgi:hypothetical protein